MASCSRIGKVNINCGEMTTQDSNSVDLYPITDQTTANIINGEWFEWSISKHSKEVMDLAKQYVHYYGTGEISGALTKEITAPGDYLIKWTSTDGATYNQTVHVVEQFSGISRKGRKLK